MTNLKILDAAGYCEIDNKGIDNKGIDELNLIELNASYNTKITNVNNMTNLKYWMLLAMKKSVN